MPRILYVLLLFVPAAIVARLIGLSPLLVFGAAALALIPLAGLIGQSTEHLASHLGGRLGGLLNATFGNAAELIISAFAIHNGLLTLVKASITGSIIGNTLLVLGSALVLGGLSHGRQRFDARATSREASLMLLAVAALYLPAVFAASGEEHAKVEELSLIVAAVLILLYVAYLLHSVFGWRSGGEGARESSANQADNVPHDLSAVGASGQGTRTNARGLAGAGQPSSAPREESGSQEKRWSIRRACLTLAGATVGAAVSSELLVGTVETVTHELGLSEFFIGMIVVAIVGNAAEHYSALQMAWRNQLDTTFAIAAGSSTQIALFAAPVLVGASLLLGHPMDIIFQPLELAILGLATAVFTFISFDGESTWLDGVLLLAVYFIAGATIFLH